MKFCHPKFRYLLYYALKINIFSLVESKNINKLVTAKIWDYFITEHQTRRGNRDDLGVISLFSTKASVVTPY